MSNDISIPVTHVQQQIILKRVSWKEAKKIDLTLQLNLVFTEYMEKSTPLGYHLKFIMSMKTY
jgi:hypothetical protein